MNSKEGNEIIEVLRCLAGPTPSQSAQIISDVSKAAWNRYPSWGHYFLYASAEEGDYSTFLSVYQAMQAMGEEGWKRSVGPEGMYENIRSEVYGLEAISCSEMFMED